ncbi:DUF1713 domain protein [Senna tora]|uniref:Small ribosomal subunit protein mS38 n=1 Tax=Senna tora TaxID=362788 RepID=A0A834TCB7_9FABA|nr:DUF1713 domain protein [Senna tora]
MASALLKLLGRRLPTTRTVSSFHTSQPLNPFEPLAFNPSPFLQINPQSHQPTVLSPVSEAINSSVSNLIFPSFPFGFYLNPVSSSGFCSPDAKEDGLDDSRTMWADSVKKKRKKKMNKHKYQKLRKRMRRQT